MSTSSMIHAMMDMLTDQPYLVIMLSRIDIEAAEPEVHVGILPGNGMDKELVAKVLRQMLVALEAGTDVHVVPAEIVDAMVDVPKTWEDG